MEQPPPPDGPDDGVDAVVEQLLVDLGHRSWASDDDPPTVLWRVVWDAGYGYPHLRERRRTSRNCTSMKNAVRQVAALLWPPGHHRLVGIYRIECGDAADVTNQVVTALAATTEHEESHDDDREFTNS